MKVGKRCISKEEFKKHEDNDVAYALYVRENLKPNDYFRTFDGQIFKSMNVSPIKGNAIYYANGDYTWVDVSAVDNFSDDPIDLIELGDYVNGELVKFISSNPKKNQKGKPRIILNETHSLFGKYESIKSIVTKEMIDSVKYEVK